MPGASVPVVPRTRGRRVVPRHQIRHACQDQLLASRIPGKTRLGMIFLGEKSYICVIYCCRSHILDHKILAKKNPPRCPSRGLLADGRRRAAPAGRSAPRRVRVRAPPLPLPRAPPPRPLRPRAARFAPRRRVLTPDDPRSSPLLPPGPHPHPSEPRCGRSCDCSPWGSCALHQPLPRLSPPHLQQGYYYSEEEPESRHVEPNRRSERVLESERRM